MALEQEVNPLSQFMYSLKAPETRRQWPQRLKMFFDFLKIDGGLDHQAKCFADKARKIPSGAKRVLSDLFHSKMRE